MAPALPACGAVLGVDVGFSPRRRSSAVCRLDWTPRTVAWTIERFRAVEPERTETLRRLAERPLRAAAFDGPLAPGLGVIGHYRVAERVLTRGVGRRIGKSGSSGAPVGRLLNAATSLCARIVKETGRVARADHSHAIDATAIVESFPTAVLGLMIETPERLACTRGNRTDVYFTHLAANGRLEALVANLLPGRRLEQTFDDVTDHDERAGLVCALAALGFAARRHVAVGDREDGWIILPPHEMWAGWAGCMLAAAGTDDGAHSSAAKARRGPVRRAGKV